MNLMLQMSLGILSNGHFVGWGLFPASVGNGSLQLTPMSTHRLRGKPELVTQPGQAFLSVRGEETPVPREQKTVHGAPVAHCQTDPLSVALLISGLRSQAVLTGKKIWEPEV